MPREPLVLSVVVAVRDEEYMLPGCLRCLGFADEVVVVVDDRTTDRSCGIAVAAGARVLKAAFSDFAALRSEGLDAASGSWVLVVDADERVDARLAREIVQACAAPEQAAYALRIANVFYGQPMVHGGWASEAPVRLFPHGSARFVGSVHEHLEFDDALEVKILAAPLLHFSHRSLEHASSKSATYGELAGRSLYAQSAPTVTPARMLRIAAYHLFRRLVWKQGWRDGVPGVFEVFRTVTEHLASQVRLWELQREADPASIYADLDRRIQVLPARRAKEESRRPDGSP